MKKLRLNSIKSKAQKGFTLIELMITVAIVGILAAVALPAYINYTIRGQVTEGFTIIGGIQTSMQEYYATTGSFPVDLDQLGINVPIGKYVESISVYQGSSSTASADINPGFVNVIFASGGGSGNTGTTGVIQVVFGNSSNANIQQKSLLMTAQDDGSGNISWTCTSPDMSQAYLPTGCTSSAGQ